MPELEREEALEAEWEITDLDPQRKNSPRLYRWVEGQRFSLRTRLCMTLCTILGLALLSWLLLSPLHMPRAFQLETASSQPIYAPSHQASSRSVQMVMVQNVIYLLDQDGLVSALWTRHKYVHVPWQQSVAPSSKLLGVDHQVVYLAAPDGSIVALLTSDGAVLWTQRRTLEPCLPGSPPALRLVKKQSA